jgi:hypothetical protein
MGKSQGLRFAAGSPDRARSSVWKLVASTKKDDIYLGPRYAMRMMKMSLHASGIWRYALTREASAVFNETGDRVSQRWSRPPPFTKGWTQGPTIAIPHTGTDDVLPELDDPRDRAVVWIPGPERGRLLTFTLLLADETVTTRSRLPIRPDDKKVGRLDMSKGRSAWVFAREAPMSEEDADRAAWFAGDIKINYPSEPGNVYASALGLNTDAEGRPAITEVVFGRRNVVVKAEAS